MKEIVIKMEDRGRIQENLRLYHSLELKFDVMHVQDLININGNDKAKKIVVRETRKMIEEWLAQFF